MLPLLDSTGYGSALFITLFLVGVLMSARTRAPAPFFPPSVSQELKGFAILGIIFSHIGYFLVDDHAFLFPLTILAGVCVNVFLFLSGYGLTLVSSKKPETPATFYRTRLLRLMVPFWLVLGITLVADYLILGRSYPTETVLRAIVGVFTSADIYLDLNSPLWYFTPILFYYLLFPLLFVRRRPWVSALAFLALTSALVYLHPSWMDGVYELYSIHFIAFPLGMLAAWLRTDTRVSESALFHQLGGWYHSLPHTPAHLLTLVTYATLLLTIAYTALHSGVGASGTLEQATSMLTTGALLALFALKRIEFRLFTLFGTYSYELYLIHWPLLVRYDVLYTHLEGWIATILYLGLFLCLGWIVQKLSDRIFQALLRPAGTP